jgi:PAS domain S-box-containing protein
MAKKRASTEVLELKDALRNVKTKLDAARRQLEEANTTLHAIQSGSVDAVVAMDLETKTPKVLNLRSAEHPYRVFVEAVAEGALTVNQDGVAIFCNRYFAEMLKTTPGKILGRPLRDFFPPYETHTVSQILSRGSREKLQQEIALLASDGALLQVQLSVSPVKTEDLEGICILATDLSEKHRTQAALHRALERARLVEDMKRALELRDEFLSIASHELRTPITSLMMQLQVTQRAFESDALNERHPRFGRAISTCIRQTMRLISLMEDLLDVSQIEAGKLKTHPEETNLTDLVFETLERFQEECKKSGCHHELQPNVIGFWDPIRLEQVLTNLLSNSFKHAASRRVEVMLRQEENSAVLIVRDFGEGIPEEEHRRIFRRFERAVNYTNVSGFGLGLYIVKQIVESHGGTIEVESKRGQGATFRVILPLRPSAQNHKEQVA